MLLFSNRNLICIHSLVLAVQNMNVCNAVDESHEIEFKALEDSLNMMSKGRSGTTLLERCTDGVFFCNSSERRAGLVGSLIKRSREVIDFQ